MGNKQLYILWVLLSVFTALSLKAQNNPYEIKDNLYAYYQRCVKEVNHPSVLLMADTLFTRAGRAGDRKAQCLAMNLKCDYYYQQENIPALKEANRKLQQFAERTPYKQYIFGCWGRLISYYMTVEDYDAALAECRAYQQKALELNNTYAIGSSYTYLGNLYFVTRDKKSALEQYRKTANYYLSVHETKNLNAAYINMSSCFRTLHASDSAIYYAKEARKWTMNDEGRILSSYMSLLRSYINAVKLDSAKMYLDSVDCQRQKVPLLGSAYQNYLLAATGYYRKSKQYELSLSFSDSLAKKSQMASCKELVYRDMEDFKNAYIWSVRFRTSMIDEMGKENTRVMAEYASRFDNERLEAEKDRLALLNAETNVQHLVNERQLMQSDRERDSLQLTTTHLQLRNSELALTNQRVETDRQTERALASERQNALQRTIIGVVLLLFFITLVFFLLHLHHRRRSFARLQQEKEVAVAARQEAETARLEAENANSLKSLFLQNVSHEIRTPLNAIVGFSEILNSPEDMGLSPEERQEYVGIIQTNTVLLTTLVNDILDLSKLESDTYVLSPSPVVVAELCRNTLASVRSRAAAGVEMRLEEPADADSIIFNTDASRLQQVLTNFLTNACKYTDRGSITLAYRVLDGEGDMEFSVTDTGCGIPPEKAELIFTRFEKLGSFKQGSGIGLNICRRIADLVGGKVYVDTTYTGGARLVFIHPSLHPSGGDECPV